MLWSQELPAYSYTHRLGSLSQGMPYCPFCQNSVPSTRAAPGHAIARKPLPGISKTWPLFEHVNSFQLDKKLTLDCQNTSNTNDSKKKCLPSWWVVLHGDYQQAHATQQTPSQGASAEATWKQDFHCRMHWFNDSWYEFLFLSHQSLQIYGTQPTSQFSVNFFHYSHPLTS